MWQWFVLRVFLIYKLMCVLEKSNLKKTVDFAVKDVPLGVGSVILAHFGKICALLHEAGKKLTHI